MNKLTNEKLYFCITDLETGGLDGKRENGTLGMEIFPILEIAMHITDHNLNILDGEGFRVVINHSEEVIASMDPWAIKQHSKTGLLDEVRSSSISLAQAEKLAIEHLNAHGAIPYDHKKKTGSIMMGNSIKFDRNYLNCQMSELDKHFHYRLADISSVALFVRSWRPDIEESINKEYQHLALADIRDSLMEAKTYKDRLFRDDCVVSDDVDVLGEIHFLSEDLSKAVERSNLDSDKYKDDFELQMLKSELKNLIERSKILSDSVRLA